jgi:hypothetical protein
LTNLNNFNYSYRDVVKVWGDFFQTGPIPPTPHSWLPSLEQGLDIFFQIFRFSHGGIALHHLALAVN